jgi:hypothetical protein
MIIAKEEIPLEKELQLHLDLPDMPTFGDTHLRVKARVARCQPDLDPRLINIGFSFIDLPKEKEPLVEEMITTYEFRRAVTLE